MKGLTNIKTIKYRIKNIFFKKYKKRNLNAENRFKAKYSLIKSSFFFHCLNNKEFIDISLFTHLPSASERILYTIEYSPNLYRWIILKSFFKFFSCLFLLRLILRATANSLQNSKRFQLLFDKIKQKSYTFLLMKTNMLKKNSYASTSYLTNLQKILNKFFENVSIENISKKFFNMDESLGEFSKRLFKIILFYSIPFVCLLNQFVSVIKARPTWDFTAIKFLFLLPKFSYWALPLLYSLLFIAKSSTIQLIILILYNFIILPNSKKFKLSEETRFNLSLASIFMLASYSITMLICNLEFAMKQFLSSYYSFILKNDLLSIVISNNNYLHLYLRSPVAFLFILMLLYNAGIYAIKGKNPHLPIITVCAQRSLN